MARKSTNAPAKAKSLRNGSDSLSGFGFVLLLIAGIALVVGVLYMHQPQDVRNQAKELGVDQLIPME